VTYIEEKRVQREKNIELLKIQHQMKKDGELVVTHTVKGKRIPNCFAGSALVSWLVRCGLVKTPYDAIKLGQELVDASLIVHVTADQVFSKSSALFRCVDQDVYAVHVQMRDPASGLAKLDPAIKTTGKKKKGEFGDDRPLGTSVKFSGKLVIDWLLNLKPLNLRSREEAFLFAQRLADNCLVESDVAGFVFTDNDLAQFSFCRELISVASFFNPTVAGWIMSHWAAHTWKKRYFVLIGDQQRLYCFDVRLPPSPYHTHTALAHPSTHPTPTPPPSLRQLTSPREI